MIGLLNSPTDCPITNYPITTWQVTKWKIGAFLTHHNRGNCNFYDYNNNDNNNQIYLLRVTQSSN